MPGDYKVMIEPDTRKPKSSTTSIPQQYQDAATTPLKVSIKDGSNTVNVVLN